MPVIKCPNGKYRIGNGKCEYHTKESADRAYKGYLGSKYGESKVKLTKQLRMVCESIDEASMRVGDDFESDHLRVHRYRDYIRFTDVTNAGKRGKKCRKLYVEAREGGHQDETTIKQITDFLTDKTTYDEFKKHIEDLAAQNKNIHIGQEDEERGVDVIPTSLKPFVFSNDKVSVDAKLDGFRVKDLTDHQNEETCISTDDRTGKRGMKKFYDFLSKNPNALKDMDFSDVVHLLGKLDIGYHRYCAMD